MEMTRRRFIKNAGLIMAGIASSGLFMNWSFAAKEEKEEEEVAPAEDLMREHGVLERLLLIYEASSRCLTSSQELSPDLLHRTVQINRDFIESYHEKLEEDYLFPRLLKAGKEVNLVNTLLTQHQAGRRLTDTILQLANRQTFQSKDHANQLAQMLDQYVRMYRPHASREDTVLFPAFKEITPEQEYKALGEQFEEKEHRLFGEGGFQTIVEEVAELEKQLGIYELSQFTPVV